jgi:SWI/SNF-related matrix-associated actin-dependent regulator 1 of chromatin subfamily A
LKRKKHKRPTLRRYQLKGVRKIKHFQMRALLADEMGLGKTIQTLQALIETESFPAVIVCPASLKHQWQEEAYTHYGLTSIVCEGRDPPHDDDDELDPKQYHLIIINYDILSTNYERNKRKKTDGKGWVRWIRRFARPKAIVFEECHYLKSRNTQRIRACRILAKNVKGVLGLSGTPLTNRPEELWAILNLIRPDKYPTFKPFGYMYCKPKRTRYGIEFKGASNLGKLHAKLSRELMIRRLVVDVLAELPKKTRTIVLFDIEKEHEYRKAESDISRWIAKQYYRLDHEGKVSKKTIRSFRQLAGMKLLILKRLAAEYKLKAATEWVDNFFNETDEKLILFCVHKKIVQHYKQRYGKAAVVIDGSVRKGERQKAVHRFNNDPKVKLLIGNIQAAGVGLNLQKGGRTVAFMELGWTPAEIEQAEARVRRMGQTKKVRVYFLIARNTIEHSLCNILQVKKSVMNAALDGKEWSDLTIFDKLTKKLRERK